MLYMSKLVAFLHLLMVGIFCYQFIKHLIASPIHQNLLFYLHPATKSLKKRSYDLLWSLNIQNHRKMRKNLIGKKNVNVSGFDFVGYCYGSFNIIMMAYQVDWCGCSQAQSSSGSPTTVSYPLDERK